MSRDINLEKLSSLAVSLSGKECAFLALEYFNKQYKENKQYRDEVEIINNSISPYSSDPKRQEFMFYYKIGSNLENFYLDLQTNMLMLKNIDNQLAQIRTLLSNSIAVSSILKSFRFIPKIVTEEEFEQLYRKVRGKFLSEVLSLDSVATHEAFLRLKEEGFLTENDDFYSCKVYFEERRNKTKEQLIEEKAQEIHKYLQETEEKRQRGVDVGEGAYQDYKDLSLDEIKKQIEVKDNLNIPTAEECQKWDEAKEKELEKLKEAVNKGQLKTDKVNEKGGWYHSGEEYLGEEGILSESWYNYSDKLDNHFNQFIDNKIDAVEFFEGEFVIAKSSFTSYVGEGNHSCAAERSRLRVEENLKMFLLFNEEEGEIDISNPKLKEAFVFWVKEAQYRMQRIAEHSEVIKRVEEKILEGVVKISDELLEKAANTVTDAINEQEESLNSILKYFKSSAYFNPVYLKDIDKYKLTAEIVSEEEWINKTINYLVRIANRESSYSYEYKI